MDKVVTVAPNQSLLDMILSEYGSLEAGMKVALANNVDISDIPATGNSRNMPLVPQELQDMEGMKYLRENGIVIGTLALPPLTYELLLKPSMYTMENAVGAPHTVGYYSFDVKEAAGFIHLNPLADTYPGDNRLYYQTEERHILGYAPESDLPAAITPMTDISIPYILPWTVGLGYMVVWSDLATPVVTPTYEDIEGNKAYAAPVTVLDNSSQDIVAQFIGDMNMELVSASASSVTVRLTRFHAPIAMTNFHDHTLEWLEEALLGSADPLDPSNPDKRILTLTAGTHTVGVKANYFFPLTIPPHPYPSSALTMVIRVS